MYTVTICFNHAYSTPRLLPKKILKGSSELKAENLGAQRMKWKVLPWKIQVSRAILWVAQATALPLGNSIAHHKLLHNTSNIWDANFNLINFQLGYVSHLM